LLQKINAVLCSGGSVPPLFSWPPSPWPLPRAAALLLASPPWVRDNYVTVWVWLLVFLGHTACVVGPNKKNLALAVAM
jgi:hypothetical protein